VDEARANVFFDRIRATLEAKEFKPHDRMIDRLLDQGHASTDICSALIHLLQGGTGAPTPAAGKRVKPALPASPDPEARPKPRYGGPLPHAAIPKPAMQPAMIKPAIAATPTEPKKIKPPAAPKPVERLAVPAVASVEGLDHNALASETAAPAVSAKLSATPAAPSAPPDSARRTPHSAFSPPPSAEPPPRKSKYQRQPRTGREPGMTTIRLNVGRAHLVTPGDIVGKIAGVTRLPAGVVGAIDIHEDHTFADVAAAEAAFIVKKLAGIPLKDVTLAPSLPPASGSHADTFSG